MAVPITQEDGALLADVEHVVTDIGVAIAVLVVSLPALVLVCFNFSWGLQIGKLGVAAGVLSLVGAGAVLVQRPPGIPAATAMRLATWYTAAPAYMINMP